jgi:hypothetical protein
MGVVYLPGVALSRLAVSFLALRTLRVCPNTWDPSKFSIAAAASSSDSNCTSANPLPMTTSIMGPKGINSDSTYSWVIAADEEKLAADS